MGEVENNIREILKSLEKNGNISSSENKILKEYGDDVGKFVVIEKIKIYIDEN